MQSVNEVNKMPNLFNVKVNAERITLSARELHEFLEVRSHYKDWIKRMIGYGFEENVDYQTIAQKKATAQGNKTTFTDHEITLDMAKEIAMIQRNEKGKQARQYFIELEKKWNSPEQIMARALLMANDKVNLLENKVECLENTIEEQKPLVEFANQVSNCEDLKTMGVTAKLLYDKGLDLGRNKLFEWLRTKEVLMSDNTPYQRYVKQGLFKVVETIKETSFGDRIQHTTMVTGKGQAWIYKKLKEEFGNEKHYESTGKTEKVSILS